MIVRTIADVVIVITSVVWLMVSSTKHPAAVSYAYACVVYFAIELGVLLAGAASGNLALCSSPYVGCVACLVSVAFFVAGLPCMMISESYTLFGVCMGCTAVHIVVWLFDCEYDYE